MLRLLHRRLGQDQSQLARRAVDGGRLRQRLGPAIVCPGAMLSPHYFWVFPILTRAPDHLISALRDTGFDATAGRSLDVVERATGLAVTEIIQMLVPCFLTWSSCPFIRR